jgi:hypothetical protein
MELNPYLHDWVSQERRADALRDAEKCRLIKSLKEHRSTPEWLQRLGLVLRGAAPVHRGSAASRSRPESRQTAASPTR